MQRHQNKEIDFIARHYRNGLFDTEKALRRIRPTHNPGRFKIRIAAAVAVVAVIGATAAVLLHTTHTRSVEPQIEIVAPPTAPETIVRAIDFEDAALPAVVKKIEETYGVEITGIPSDAGSLTLSLHYEGTATDLIETINDILGTQLKAVTHTQSDER